MLRAFLLSAEADASLLILDGEEARHLAGSRRAREGDAVEVLNGKGEVWSCTVAAVEKRLIRLDVAEYIALPRPAPQLTLVQALPKGQKLELILQKTTELGVAEILPVQTEFSEKRIQADRLAAKMERWTKICIEACKQSGNPWLPTIHAPIPFAELPADLPPLLLADAGGESPGSLPHGEHWAVCIGPEGGFSPGEFEQLQERGAIGLRLGPYILRSETAAVAAVARIMAD